MNLDSFSANAVRYGFAIPLLGLMNTGKGSGPLRKIKAHNRRTIQLIVLGTALTTTLGTYFWGDAIRFIGASKAATIDATAPLFATIAAILILGEKVSWKTIFGTVLTIIGIWLVV
jgi:drug/metabolite transporter (DMT)-like permease